MANPSLKAQIEAAKSALENSPERASTGQMLDDSTIKGSGLKTTPDNNPSDPEPTNTETSFDIDAAALDARITILEKKLSENQRDLHTLLGKVREVTRFQNSNEKKTTRENLSQKDLSPKTKNVNKSKSRGMAIMLAILIGITVGTGLFLATDVMKSNFLVLPTSTLQFSDFISDVMG